MKILHELSIPGAMAPQSRNGMFQYLGAPDEAEARKIDSSDAWNFTSSHKIGENFSSFLRLW